MHSPIEEHMQVVRKILSYLKATPSKGILFKTRAELNVQGFTYANYGGSLIDRRSTTGHCIFWGKNLVSWRSKKYNVMARSSAEEAEFRAMALGSCELLWLHIILKDLKIKIQDTIELFCDNQSAITIAHNPI